MEDGGYLVEDLVGHFLFGQEGEVVDWLLGWTIPNEQGTPDTHPRPSPT